MTKQNVAIGKFQQQQVIPRAKFVARCEPGGESPPGLCWRSSLSWSKNVLRHQVGQAVACSTALRINFLNSSMPSSNPAAMGSTGVFFTRRLNFLRFSSAAGSSILLATT